MQRQIEMFERDICEGFHGGNQSSQEAFEEIKPKLKNLRMVILRYAAGRRNLTVKGVIHDLRISHQTASARLSEMTRDGWLEKTDLRRAGCHVLRISDLGRSMLSAQVHNN